MSAMHNATGLDVDVIKSMLLTSYDGIAADLSALNPDDPASFVPVTRRQWLLFRASRLCPFCLEERGGAWRMSWKLPWSFACTQHLCLLADECPGCAQPFSSGTGDSCLPAHWGKVPCPHAAATARHCEPGAPPTREPCGHHLVEVPVLELGPNSSVIGAQTVFNRALSEGFATLAGETVSSVEFLGEARSLYSMLLHHGRGDDFPELPAAVGDALEAFYRRRDEMRAAPENGNVRQHLVMYRKTLTDLPVMAGLAPKVTVLLASSSLDELSTNLEDLAHRVYTRHGGRLGLRQYYGVSPRLEAALLAGMPRRRSRIWVKGELDQFAEDAQPDAGEFASRVPPMLWPGIWEEDFRRLIPTRAHWQARRFVSMLLVKLRTQCSWPAASRALGYQHLPGASVAVGYVNRASREGTIEALRGAAERITQRVQNAELPVDYQQRRVAFATLARVDDPAWKVILAGSGMTDTTKRRYCSAVWLWSELTGGYPTDAPGWADTPARAPEMYQHFLRDNLPSLRPALLDHGRELLILVGDAQPSRAELLLG